MARQSKTDQTEHELFLAREFVAHLLAFEGIMATGLRPGDPVAGEPDAMCLVGDVPHGIELVDCWRSGAEAKVTWAAARAAYHQGIRGMVASTSDLSDVERQLSHPSGDELAAIAELRLRETPKAYGVPTWLLLNASQTIAALHDDRDGPRLLSQIRKPERFAFKDAYLVLARSWAQGRRFFRIP